MIRLPLGPGADACFTVRAGGVSTGPYAGPDGDGGLNLGLHVGDAREDVLENRRRVAEAVGATIEWMDQVHGCDLVTVSEATGRDAAGTADAIVVDHPGIAPAVLVADCVPVLLASESGELRAAVHVGRKGLVNGVLGVALDALRARTDEPLHAVVGPHICGACYEVSAELAREAEAVEASATTRWGTPSIDLAAGVRAQLGDVATVSVGLCTLEDARFYSYRREPVTGRIAGIAVTRRDASPRGAVRADSL